MSDSVSDVWVDKCVGESGEWVTYGNLAFHKRENCNCRNLFMQVPVNKITLQHSLRFLIVSALCTSMVVLPFAFCSEKDRPFSTRSTKRESC